MVYPCGVTDPGPPVNTDTATVTVRYEAASTGFSLISILGNGTVLPAQCTLEIYEAIVQAEKGDKGDKGDRGATGIAIQIDGVAQTGVTTINFRTS